MKVRLRHKESGRYAIGTFDRIPGCALASQFALNDAGELEPEYEGETDVWWDGQESETDPMTDELFLVTEENDVYLEGEFERIPVEEEEEQSA